MVDEDFPGFRAEELDLGLVQLHLLAGSVTSYCEGESWLIYWNRGERDSDDARGGQKAKDTVSGCFPDSRVYVLLGSNAEMRVSTRWERGVARGCRVIGRARQVGMNPVPSQSSSRTVLVPPSPLTFQIAGSEDIRS